MSNDGWGHIELRMFHSEGEIAENWLAEVQHRARELDEGIVQPIPADEVRRKARALLR